MKVSFQVIAKINSMSIPSYDTMSVVLREKKREREKMTEVARKVE